LDPPSKRTSVLVVDDDEAVLETVLEVLRTEFDAEAVSSPYEALRTMAGKDFDVLVTDWDMPGMDGVALFKEVVKRGLPTAVLLMTGMMDDFTEDVAPEDRKLLGMIAKPFAPSQMLDRIRQLGRMAAMKAAVRRLKGPGQR
jgi:two-component system response regulator GlrR